MRRAALVILVLQTALLVSQTTPALHQRGEAEQGPQTHTAQGFSSLPDEASGEYELDERGSVVQITIEHNHLTGYVTKIDQETALTLYFDNTFIHGTRLSFTTKIVHGINYSFTGTIVRGDATNASQPGLYNLVGKWTTSRGTGRVTKSVSLKSTPRLQ